MNDMFTSIGSKIEGVNLPLVPSESTMMPSYTHELQHNVDVLDYWFAKSTSNSMEMQLDTFNNLTFNDLSGALDDTLSILQVLADLLQCSHIIPFLNSLVTTLQ